MLTIIQGNDVYHLTDDSAIICATFRKYIAQASMEKNMKTYFSEEKEYVIDLSDIKESISNLISFIKLYDPIIKDRDLDLRSVRPEAEQNVRSCCLRQLDIDNFADEFMLEHYLSCKPYFYFLMKIFNKDPEINIIENINNKVYDNVLLNMYLYDIPEYILTDTFIKMYIDEHYNGDPIIQLSNKVKLHISPNELFTTLKHNGVWLKEGLNIEIDDDGNQIRNFYHKGRLHGIYQKYSLNKIIYYGEWYDGLKNGIEKHWHNNGILASITTLKMGNIIGVKQEWYDNKKPSEISTYEDGMRDGISEKWYKNGILATYAEWKKDNHKGLSMIWDKNGIMELYEHI